jgi:hypothetical protein
MEPAIVIISSSPPMDVSAFVLRRLDRHLRDLQLVRDRMRLNTTTGAGDRMVLALDGAALAERFAAELREVLRPSAGL